MDSPELLTHPYQQSLITLSSWCVKEQSWITWTQQEVSLWVLWTDGVEVPANSPKVRRCNSQRNSTKPRAPPQRQLERDWTSGRAAGQSLTLHGVRLQRYIWTNHKISGTNGPKCRRSRFGENTDTSRQHSGGGFRLQPQDQSQDTHSS